MAQFLRDKVLTCKGSEVAVEEILLPKIKSGFPVIQGIG
jgi:hypothetical protein